MPKKQCPICDSTKTKKGHDSRWFRLGQNRACKDCQSEWRTAPFRVSAVITVVVGAISLAIGIAGGVAALVMKDEGGPIGIAIVVGVVFFGTGASALFQGICVLKGVAGMDQEKVLKQAVQCPQCQNDFLVDGLLTESPVNCPQCNNEMTA